jgi:DNA-binding HxlR family transcriptional regulator
MTTDPERTEWRSCCAISSALDVLGDKWSLLIIRDLIVHGTRTFSQFLDSPEHISTNILAARLKLLSGLNLIERTDPNASASEKAAASIPSLRLAERPSDETAASHP